MKLHLWILLGFVLAFGWASSDVHYIRNRRGAVASPASAGGYNIGNKGSTLSVSSALGAYNSFVGNVGVQGAYGSTALGLGAALGTYGSYLNEGGGYGGGQSGYGFGGSFYSNKNRR